ncbi:hypothetical protein ACLOJK_037430 [Asimina triloba]
MERGSKGELGEGAEVVENGFEGPTIDVLEEQGHVAGGLADDNVTTNQVRGVSATKNVNVVEDLVAGGGVSVNLEELEDAHDDSVENDEARFFLKKYGVNVNFPHPMAIRSYG